MNVEKYFLENLKKDTTIAKDDILRIAEESGIAIKPRIARVKIIDQLVELGFYNKLFEYFNEFITIPSWEVADFYNISTAKVDKLRAIGTIKETAVKKEFYSRKDKGYFKADTYPLSVLTYDAAELNKAYENAYGGDTYNLRIETKSKDEIPLITNELKKVFKIENEPNVYEHRNGDGLYSYFKIKLFNGSKEEENRYLLKIKELENKNEETKKDYQERIDNILDILKKYLGEDLNLNRFSLEEKLEKLVNKDID